MEKWKNIPWGLGQLQIDIYGINFVLLISKVLKFFQMDLFISIPLAIIYKKIVMCRACIIF